MEQRIELVPNCSLSPKAAGIFFAATCLYLLSFAIIFALRGYWRLVPFWFLEMIGLGAALFLSLRRKNHTQTLLITDDCISLVTKSRRGEAKQDFARHWAKVRLRSPLSRSGVSRLTIESHGRACEVGGFLTEEDRCDLARRLKRLVGGVNESPPLEVANLGD